MESLALHTVWLLQLCRYLSHDSTASICSNTERDPPYVCILVSTANRNAIVPVHILWVWLAYISTRKSSYT